MPSLPLNELVRIAAAGGGFDINTREHEVNELTRIASAGGKNKSRLRFLQCGHLTEAELTRIAAAGKSAVWFDI